MLVAPPENRFDSPGQAHSAVVFEHGTELIPPSVKLSQAKGFALYAMRTLLSGRGDELVELTKANARQII